MKRREGDFEEFLAEVEADARRTGTAAELRLYREHFALAVQLIRLRKAKRWTQQQLARASGVQQSEISRIERGQANPTWKTLLALARTAKMTVAFVPAKRKRSA